MFVGLLAAAFLAGAWHRLADRYWAGVAVSPMPLGFVGRLATEVQRIALPVPAAIATPASIFVSLAGLLGAWPVNTGHLLSASLVILPACTCDARCAMAQLFKGMVNYEL